MRIAELFKPRVAFPCLAPLVVPASFWEYGPPYLCCLGCRQVVLAPKALVKTVAVGLFAGEVPLGPVAQTLYLAGVHFLFHHFIVNNKLALAGSDEYQAAKFRLLV